MFKKLSPGFFDNDIAALPAIASMVAPVACGVVGDGVWRGRNQKVALKRLKQYGEQVR
jgi:hypothetical protein